MRLKIGASGRPLRTSGSMKGNSRLSCRDKRVCQYHESKSKANLIVL